MTKTTEKPILANQNNPLAHPRKGSKIAAAIDLLARKRGATLDELMSETEWQKHTVRSALTGLRKRGHDIARKKRGELSCYHIAKSA